MLLAKLIIEFSQTRTSGTCQRVIRVITRLWNQFHVAILSLAILDGSLQGDWIPRQSFRRARESNRGSQLRSLSGSCAGPCGRAQGKRRRLLDGRCFCWRWWLWYAGSPLWLHRRRRRRRQWPFWRFIRTAENTQTHHSCRGQWWEIFVWRTWRDIHRRSTFISLTTPFRSSSLAWWIQEPNSLTCLRSRIQADATLRVRTEKHLNSQRRWEFAKERLSSLLSGRLDGGCGHSKGRRRTQGRDGGQSQGHC
jgi:hypothetical protein